MTGAWSDWQVREIAHNFATKRPKREWFKMSGDYLTSLKSWAHLCARQLSSMALEERQLLIFVYHMGLEHVGVQTFDPQDKGIKSEFEPSEENHNGE